MESKKHRSIWVEEEVWKKLIKIKYENNYRSLNDLIKKLLELFESKGNE
jgi:hypothetical protein